MTTTVRADICVVGGGPAGSTAARRLALLGHSVHLVERAVFPRRRLGDSLAPGISQVLGALGHHAPAGLHPAELFARWAGAEHHAPTFVADRGVFDTFLLDQARTAGVRISQPALARRPRRHDGDGGWRIEVRQADQRFDLECRFLVDAGGRTGLLRGNRRRAVTRTTALYGYWTPSAWEGPDVRVEAGRDEWLCATLLPDSTVDAMVFVERARCMGLARDARSRLYRSLLFTSDLVGPWLGTQLTGTFACDATSSITEDAVGRDWIKIGEAALTLDPLSSQGVQTAMTTAMQGSAAVHSILRRHATASTAAAFYRSYLQRIARLHEELAAEHYSRQRQVEHRQFWIPRAVAPSGSRTVAGAVGSRPEEARPSPVPHSARTS
ncbi:NAD(P)/FAD-dependent oxidoreductase [Streptomyces atroolivaceus]|uniref:NAD(P)/FAD-dependent oxidoreductase n=1 Tax=Streptomyces atroolivaceus TaxID=66869 RepID=UPI00369FF7D8